MIAVEIILLLMVTGNHVTLVNLQSATKSNDTITPTEVTSTPEFTTEYEYNVSTLIINTTETPITTTNKTLKLLKPKKGSLGTYKHELGCLCNLHNNACDIGCCCDKDCSYEMKKVFEHCEEPTETYIDRNACQYFEKSYVNYSLHEWEILNNDFLCVAKTNIPPSYTVQKDKPFRSYTETISAVKTHNFWPQTISEASMIVNYSKPYIQGVPLKYILNNSTMAIFNLSEAFFMDACDFQSRVLYLRDIDRECVHLLNERSYSLNAEYYYNILFVAQPNKLNLTTMENMLMTCPEPLCVKPRTKICSEKNLRECRDLNGTEIIGLRCYVKDKYQTCQNILDSFKILIAHEGVKGIKNITFFIHLVNVTSMHIDQYEINQHISVVYEWASRRLNFSDILSGNPGYLIGKPIVIAALVNNSISRNSSSYRDNFLCLPQEDMGICEIGKYNYQPIEFGYNTILLCKVRQSLIIQNNTKPTELCRKMQDTIMEYWSIHKLNGDFESRVFGLFGNANTSIYEEWGNIYFEISPKNISNNITGFISKDNKTLQCFGLVFGLDINIYHTKVDLDKLVDQEKILGITIEFHRSKNISRIFNILDHKVIYEIDLDNRVTFFDITLPKLRKIVDPPSLNIELPSDFFYPFVKMGNSGNLVVPQSLFVFFNFFSLSFKYFI